MKLQDIGFYTLEDGRAERASASSPLWRCELILTGRCNFKCPYCRRVGGADVRFRDAADVVMLWAKEGLRNIRFSGGEPTLYPGIFDLCAMARDLGVQRIAISSNGSASRELYDCLLACGVNDFSISLDACCAEDANTMTGGVKDVFGVVTGNIRYLAAKTYATVGVVLTEQNSSKVNDIIRFADSLGVADVRVIPAAQDGSRLTGIYVDSDLLARHPILAYRIANIQSGRPVRGLHDGDCSRCGLVLDDMAVNQGKHYPCIIYLRENGKPIGNVGPDMRVEREAWYRTHDCKADPICSKNCLDVCVNYNNRFAEFHR